MLLLHKSQIFLRKLFCRGKQNLAGVLMLGDCPQMHKKSCPIEVRSDRAGQKILMFYFLTIQIRFNQSALWLWD